MKLHYFWLGLLCSLVWVGCGTETIATPTVESVQESVEVDQIQPTDTPRITSTETAVPSTSTPLPPTETPAPTATATVEPAKVTTLSELVGYWEYEGFQTNAGGRLHYFYRFRADGVMEIADSVADIEAGEIKARTDFWFVDGTWYTQQVSGFWSNNTCYTGTGKPLIGSYEIRPLDDGVVRFFRMGDSCKLRKSLSDNDAIFTQIQGEERNWFVDAETGLPLNPNKLPGDGYFVLVGTLLALDAADLAAPQALLRLPSGEVFSFIAPPLESIQIDGEEAIDLAAYNPEFPIRARLVVQANDPFVIEEMVVLTTLK